MKWICAERFLKLNYPLGVESKANFIHILDWKAALRLPSGQALRSDLADWVSEMKRKIRDGVQDILSEALSP
jgi:hypothetical protein